MFKECPKLVVLWPASRNSLGRKFHYNIAIISETLCFNNFTSIRRPSGATAVAGWVVVVYYLSFFLRCDDSVPYSSYRSLHLILSSVSSCLCRRLPSSIKPLWATSCDRICSSFSLSLDTKTQVVLKTRFKTSRRLRVPAMPKSFFIDLSKRAAKVGRFVTSQSTCVHFV